MRVLHVIPGLEAEAGGPSLAAVGICRALLEARVAVELAATRDALDRRPVVDHSALDGHIRFFPSFRGHRFGLSFELRRWLAAAIPGYDLVHVHSLFNYPSHIAATLARRLGRPYVVRPAGILSPWALRQGALRKRAWLRFVDGRNIRRLAAFHATSTAEAEDLSAVFPAVPVHVVPLGVELPAMAGRMHRAADAPLQLLFLSRLHPKKNLPTLFAAVRELGRRGVPAHLRVAGRTDPGNESYGESLRRLAVEMGVSERVTFVGFVTGEAKEAELRRADLFVLPSHEENFGIAVLEALARGVPVAVSTGVALAREVEAAGAGVVVAPEDVQDLADRIAALARDEPARREMCGRARALAENFTWESVARRLVEMYQRVLDGARGQR